MSVSGICQVNFALEVRESLTGELKFLQYLQGVFVY